jgi:hypothetical protein
MENCSSGKTAKQYFTKVVFPLPEGAENIITLFINMLDAGSWEREVYIKHPSPNILLLQYV